MAGLWIGRYIIEKQEELKTCYFGALYIMDDS